MALRTTVLFPGSLQHHQKQAAPFDLHAFQYDLSGIWNQRFLFHRAQPEFARAALLLTLIAPPGKCLLWFTKSAEEPLYGRFWVITEAPLTEKVAWDQKSQSRYFPAD
jgi:hypothetical protein